jgi:S-adenosylmethionine synthetase
MPASAGKAEKISLRMPDRMSDNISDGMPDEDVTQDAN